MSDVGFIAQVSLEHVCADTFSHGTFCDLLGEGGVPLPGDVCHGPHHVQACWCQSSTEVFVPNGTLFPTQCKPFDQGP